MKKLLWIGAALLWIGSAAFAQEVVIPESGDWLQIEESFTTDCFGGSSGDEDSEPVRLTFWVSEDGSQMVGVQHLEDLYFVQTDSGEYTGGYLYTMSEGYEYTSTLTVISPTEMREEAEITIFDCSRTSTRRYERADDGDSQIWMETVREVENDSLLGPCLGRELVRRPPWLEYPDFLITVTIDEEAGTALIDDREYEGGGGEFVNIQDDTDDEYLPQLTTRTFTMTSDDTATFRLHAIANGRDDCQIIYTGALVLFDGDLDTLLTLIDETIIEATPEP
jgi:hypothetical protein